MYRMLLAAFGIPEGSSFNFDLAQQCYGQLMDLTTWHEPSLAWRPKVLLVDEYQALEPKVLRELMSIHERCRIPLVLSGNKERLANSKRDAAAVAQIENRIGPRVFLDRPTAEDCESIGV